MDNVPSTAIEPKHSTSTEYSFTEADRQRLAEVHGMLTEFREILMALAPMAQAMGLPVPGLASGSAPSVSPW